MQSCFTLDCNFLDFIEDQKNIQVFISYMPRSQVHFEFITKLLLESQIRLPNNHTGYEREFCGVAQVGNCFLNSTVEDIFVLCLYKHWVVGNEFSMPRFVYAFAARARARADTVAVLHSKRKHVCNYSLYSRHLTRTQFCTRTNIMHIVILLSLCKYT